jgi:hypothetical protein
MRTMILTAVLAVVALAFSLTTAAALYDVSGSSGPHTFATGAFPPGTPTASPTATSSPPATPTATATPTIEPCGENDDARLAFRPDKINLHGTGPFSTSIILANHGHTSTARAVVLGLEAADPAELVDRVAFANGQVWDVHGGGRATLYLVGDLPPGESVGIPLTVYMRPAWEDPILRLRLRSGSTSRSLDASRSPPWP